MFNLIGKKILIIKGSYSLYKGVIKKICENYVLILINLNLKLKKKFLFYKTNKSNIKIISNESYIR